VNEKRPDGPDREEGGPSAQESRPGAAPGISLVPEPLAEADVQAQLEEGDVDAPRVGIVMGSKSDMEAMEQAARELEERGILHEVRVMSAHREPDVVAEYAKNARMRGLRVIIAAAGDRGAAVRPPDGRRRPGRDPLDRPDAPRRACRLRWPGQPAQRGDPCGADPWGLARRAPSRLPNRAVRIRLWPAAIR
jgi:AIR carboxylase